MQSVIVILEKGNEQYAAYSDKISGVYGAGDTAAEAKESFIQAIKLLKKYSAPEKIPSVLKGEYKLLFQFDTQSLLNFYKGVFTKSALERITGINQRQLQHYASGLKKPRQAQKEKIQKALHNLGSELMAVEL